MKTAYSFIRWSSKRQGNDSRDSEARQKRSAESWCQENGYTLDKQAFIGAGEGAYKGKHLKTKDGVAIGALARFIDCVEKSLIKSGSVLCIDSVDRFQRQEIMSALAPFTKLLDLGIGIVFTGSYHKKLITNELLNKEPHWLQVIINDMIRSWSESDEKSRKIKSAKERKRLEILNGKPVPHNNAPKYFTWNAKKGQYEHNEKTATVRNLATMFLAGNSLYSIARRLNDKHVPTVKTDANWSGNAVRCILRNRALVGEFLGNKAFFPPIIDQLEFDRIQNGLDTNACFNRGKLGSIVNVFRGTAFCSCCESSMCTLTQRKNPRTKKPYSDQNRYRYLRCSSQGTGKNCAHTYVLRVASMEEEFFGNFLLQDPRELMADTTQAQDLNAEIVSSQSRISKCSTTIEKLLSMVDDSTKNIAELKTKLKAANAERDAEKGRLDELILQRSKVETAPGHFDDLKKLVRAFDTEPDGASYIGDDLKLRLSPEAKAFDEAVERMTETLKDNEVRLKIRTMLPTVIGKIMVDTRNRTWQVFNHSGNCIYKSLSHWVPDNFPITPP